MSSKLFGDQGTYHFDIQNILDKNSVVFGDLLPTLPPDRKFMHIMKLKIVSKLVLTIPYCHPIMYKEKIEKVIKELLKMRHNNPSFSQFATLVVFVKKNDGTMQICIFVSLNKKTIDLIPRIGELIHELHGVVYFSKIDLKLGHHQIYARDEGVHKIEFICHFGHFEFLVIPFGLKNAPTSFQSCLNRVLNKLRK